MREYTMKAMKSTSEWNRQFLKERNEERRAYFDMQTFVRSRVFIECVQFYQLSAKLCFEKRHYTPALKKWGVYWFTSVRHSVCPSIHPSVLP